MNPQHSHSHPHFWQPTHWCISNGPTLLAPHNHNFHTNALVDPPFHNYPPFPHSHIFNLDLPHARPK